MKLVRTTALAIALLSLPMLAVARPGRGGGSPEDCEARSEMHEVRQEIAAMELVAALQLDAGQRQELADLVREGLQRREARRAENEGSREQELELLLDYRDELAANGAPSDATVSALQALRSERRSGRQEMGGRGEMREALMAILDEGQLETLRSFKPMEGVRPERAEGEERSRRMRRSRGGEGADFGPRPGGDEEFQGRGLREGGEEGHGGRGRGRRARMLRRLLVSEAMLSALSR